MRRRRMGTGVALVAFAATVAGPDADAATSPPPPSVRIVTSVLGQPVPTATLSGYWESRSRVLNELTVSGTTVSGTVSSVAAAWTSKWVWTVPRHIAILVRLSADEASYGPGLADSTYSYTLQERARGGRWTRDTSTVDQPFDPLYERGFVALETDKPLARERVQFRVLFRASLQGSSRWGFSLTTALTN